MSLKHVLIIIAILLAAVLVVGLILCRPMAVTNYASGVFSFDAVTEVYVWAFEETGGKEEVEALAITDEHTVSTLIDFFDGKGFGRTPGSLLFKPHPTAEPGDLCWGVTFRCTITGSSLTAQYTGGLTLTGGDTAAVITQDESAWADNIYYYILSLYPEPEAPEGEE